MPTSLSRSTLRAVPALPVSSASSRTWAVLTPKSLSSLANLRGNEDSLPVVVIAGYPNEIAARASSSPPQTSTSGVRGIGNRRWPPLPLSQLLIFGCAPSLLDGLSQRRMSARFWSLSQIGIARRCWAQPRPYRFATDGEILRLCHRYSYALSGSWAMRSGLRGGSRGVGSGGFTAVGSVTARGEESRSSLRSTSRYPSLVLVQPPKQCRRGLPVGDSLTARLGWLSSWQGHRTMSCPGRSSIVPSLFLSSCTVMYLPTGEALRSRQSSTSPPLGSLDRPAMLPTGASASSQAQGIVRLP